MSSRLDQAIETARALERWGSGRRWIGSDPYDALNARRLPAAARRSPMALRIITQAVKRSPLDLRPLLGVPQGLSAATMAYLISAYARNGFLAEAEARDKIQATVRALDEMRLTQFSEPAWGYHFDVQTRVFFYPRTTPNTIATAFAGLGLLDAYELAAERSALELAQGVGEFFLRHVPQTQSDNGAYFGYLPGDSTPIHNASMLIAALLGRLARLLGRDDFGQASAAAVAYTVACQQTNGAWFYGELPRLEWVDGFHTGYVLDSLRMCIDAGVGGVETEETWHRGLQFYVERLIDADGTPRYTPESRYPVDTQCAAQAIETLARAADHAPELAARRWDVLDYARRRLRRSDGAFVFQRERFWVNRTPHPRWVQAPMLKALVHLISAGA